MSLIEQLIQKQAEAVAQNDFQTATDIEEQLNLMSESRWGLE